MNEFSERKITMDNETLYRMVRTPLGAGGDLGQVREFNDALIKFYHESNGNLEGDFATRLFFLLTTTGRRSGNRHTVPLGYVIVDGRTLAVASSGGNARNPAWILNIVHDPRVHVEIAGEAYDTVAKIVGDDEYEALFTEVLKIKPQFAKYRTMTTRKIPLVDVSAARL